MRHVATRQKEWTVKELYAALFDYCFPIDYKARLRRRLEGATQGRTRVRDFVREIQQLAVRFPDVTDFQLVQIFWKGVHQYIRLHLIEKGMNPEKTPLDRLVKHAVRREEAHEQARQEERDFQRQVPGRPWEQFANRSRGSEPWESKEEFDERQSYADEQQANEVSPQKTTEHMQTASTSKKRNRLSEEELDYLRAEGRCFTCKEVGHQSQNCHTRQTAKAPTMTASSVRFAKIEELAERAREADEAGIRISSVRLGQPNSEEPTVLHAVEQKVTESRDFTRNVPMPIVVAAHVNGNVVQALLDTGSMADFLSKSVADKLGLQVELLRQPLPVQLPVHGSGSSIDSCTTVDFAYQDICCKRSFDIIDLDDYDMILGTPFLFQYQVSIALNPVQVRIGSVEPITIQGEDTAAIESAAADIIANKTVSSCINLESPKKWITSAVE